jgi:putative phosphonate metabolism protein
MTAGRYAIYFVPPRDGALYGFGASALGYDSYSGRQVPQLSGDELPAAEWRHLTAEPRRYGFHATLKAPFRLRSGLSESEMMAELVRFAARHAPCAGFAAEIRILDGFAALGPTAPVPAIDLLAASCVRDFDRFRRPMTRAERTRRRAQALTARQIEHLDAWGYPYVFEDFRFHMTLTGRIPPDRTAPVLRFLHGALKRRPVPCNVVVGSVALLRQDGPDARFRVIREAALRKSQHRRRVQRTVRGSANPHSDHQART